MIGVTCSLCVPGVGAEGITWHQTKSNDPHHKQPRSQRWHGRFLSRSGEAVSRLVHNQQVAGSNPACATTRRTPRPTNKPRGSFASFPERELILLRHDLAAVHLLIPECYVFAREQLG